ncbi:glycosyltransferase [Spirosoma fluviale]|uniref:Glycosyltransferase involved in cell wall bisynthesis n=1 Tax=Spirosoma fluviale TaxID=1597977 RepID=A0A286FEJ0_9BACT|nr:glycosyltransferase [Spirosoma fluviale]SOD81254.1 Glycosyltransferase involved in cell wall bisynthesis [Spirosoma fluviale]
MRILIVCSGNAPNFDVRKHQAFIHDQVEAVKQLDHGLQIDYFFIKGKGWRGYLACLTALKQLIASQSYQVVHAHVAMSGLLANLQRQVPVVTTFHGSDINVPMLRFVSLFVDFFSRKTVYISQALANKAIYAGKAKRAIIPCGVDFDLFVPRLKIQSRQALGLSLQKRYVLFSSAFDVAVKNYQLARAAVDLLEDDTVELLELKNYTRAEVALLFSAVDVALLTSFSEGSPQFVKEALACNCPVVSTDVGNVRAVISTLSSCYLTTYDPHDVAGKLRQVLTDKRRVATREHIVHFDNRLIARRILDVYTLMGR